MSTGTKQPHAATLASAEAFRELFQDVPASGRFKTCGTVYDRWCIAGSLRRLCPEVGDVEHVVIPRRTKHLEAKPQAGLFGEPAHEEVWLIDLWDRLDELVEEGVCAKVVYGESHRWGEKYRGVVFQGVKHEIFAADAQNWGAILAIRTGPVEFSKHLVGRLKGLGVYVQEGGYVRWACGPHAGEVVPCPEEQAYFELCEVAWKEPEKRG
jgi:DNA polymerase/3'-5' exonuclease PolX